MSRRPLAPWFEGLAAGTLVPLIGLLFPADPSFRGLAFFPQATLGVVVAALLGVGPGMLSLAMAATMSLLAPYAALGAGATVAIDGPSVLFAAARLPFAVTLAGILAAGSIRDAAFERESRFVERFRELVRRNTRLSIMTDALTTINEELEARVSGQRESVSMLYARIRKLESVDLGTVLKALLEAVAAFSQAECAAIYEYDSQKKKLVLRSNIGAPPPRELSLDSSIEGWVFRNDSPFSLRMLNSYLNLARIDSKRSVLTYPLKAGDQIWGVLNIEEMPFYRFNPTTEKNLEIIVSLAAAYIKKSVEFRERVLSRPRNEITGLPGYGELARVLAETLASRAGGRGSISFVLVEFLDFDRLVFEYSGVKALGLLKKIVEAAGAEGRVIAFHYKEDGQLAFVLRGVDRDGASLFCLDLMQKVNEGSWQIDGREIRLEPIFGLASAGESNEPEPFFAEAENLLAVSRNAMSARGEVAAEAGGAP